MNGIVGGDILPWPACGRAGTSSGVRYNGVPPSLARKMVSRIFSRIAELTYREKMKPLEKIKKRRFNLYASRNHAKRFHMKIAIETLWKIVWTR